MTVFVVGHGAYWEGEENAGLGGKYTIVPNGMRIFFYAQPGEGLLPMNALEVLRTNAAAGYIDAADGETQIPNYCFSALDDFEYRFMLSGVQPGQDVRFIGRDNLVSVDRLCTSSGYCTPNEHRCSGLFATVSDPQVHLLTCRVGPLPVGTVAADAPQHIEFQNTYHVPGETADNPVHYNAIQEVAEEILDLANAEATSDGEGVYFTDLENAAAGALFDQQDQAMQIKLMAVQQVQVWSYQRYARLTVRAFLASKDESGLNGWKNGLKNEEKRWYSWDPYLKKELGL